MFNYYENDWVKTQTKIVEASDSCQTTGLENIPQDYQYNHNYIIESPFQRIKFIDIINGECSFTIDVYLDQLNGSTTIEDAGLIQVAPKFD